jgi:hypothetical protein
MRISIGRAAWQLALSLGLLCIIAFPAQAAIGVTEGAAEIVSTSQSSTYAFGSFTPATNNVIVVIALVRGSVGVGSITNTSGTSLTWTLKTSATFNAGADTVYVLWAITPSSTAASVYTVSSGADAGTGCVAYMFQFSGADLLTPDPLKQAVTNSGTSTNPTATVTALGTLNGYASAWAGGLSSSNPANVSTPPTSWTEIGDNGFASPTTNGTGAFRAGGETGTSVTFTAASTTWGLAAVEVYVSGAGPAPPSDMGRRVIRME